MKKKTTLIFIIILLIAIIISGIFIIKKINKNKRDYKLEEVSDYNYFVIKSNDKYGVIDKEGKVIIDASYDKVEIPNPSKDVFICYKNEKGIAMNEKNEQLFAEYNSVVEIPLKNIVSNLPYEKSVLKTEKNGKYGMIDFTGKKLLETEYDKIESFSGVEGQLEIQKNEKVGVVNLKGIVLIKPEYDVINFDNYYSDKNDHGYIVGIKNDDGYKYGYINNDGKLIINIEYNEIARVADIPSEQGLYLIAAKNGQYGIIKNKKTLINNEYQLIEYDKQTKVFIAQKGKKYGAIDLNGKIMIPVENTNIEAKGENIYIERNNIKEVYDSKGNKTNVEFNTTIIPTSNDNYKVIITSTESGNYYGLLDKDNKQIINSDYLYLEYVYGNYFIVCGQNGKLGIIDDKGNVVVETKYDLMQKIEGKNMLQSLLAETNMTELYSKDLTKICEMKNATVNNDKNYVRIYSKNDIKYFNGDGASITSQEALPNKKLYVSCVEGKWGYVDGNNKTVIENNYEFATEFNKYGFAAVKKDGKWGVLNEKGDTIVGPSYVISEENGNMDCIGQYIKVQNEFDEYYTKDLIK